jgi:hypothetical protein
VFISELYATNHSNGVAKEMNTGAASRPVNQEKARPTSN